MRKSAWCVFVLVVSSLVSCRSGNKAPESPVDPLPIRVVELPAATHIVRAHVGAYEEMGDNFGAFIAFLDGNGIVPQGDLMGVYLDDPSKAPHGQCRYEIRMPVLPGTQVQAPYEIRLMPRTTTAAVVLLGDYPGIARRYGEIYEWISANGWQVAGPMMEVYLVHPGSGVSPDQYETEVHIPVVPAE